MKKALARGAVACSAAALTFGCFGNHVQASTAAETARCGTLSAQEREHGYAALNAGTWVGPALAVRHYGRAVHRETVGVVLYVPAAPGLSAAWLHRAAECRIEEESRGSNASSPFALTGTDVEVINAKKGYFVRVTAKDGDAIDQLVRRAGY